MKVALGLSVQIGLVLGGLLATSATAQAPLVFKGASPGMTSDQIVRALGAGVAIAPSCVSLFPTSVWKRCDMEVKLRGSPRGSKLSYWARSRTGPTVRFTLEIPADRSDTPDEVSKTFEQNWGLPRSSRVRGFDPSGSTAASGEWVKYWNDGKRDATVSFVPIGSTGGIVIISIGDTAQTGLIGRQRAAYTERAERRDSIDRANRFKK